MEIIAELQTCAELYGSESAPSVVAKSIKRQNGSGVRNNPGGLVINCSLTGRQARRPVTLFVFLGEPVSVIQNSHVDPLLPELPPLLIARSFSLQGLPPLLAEYAASIGPYTAAPSKLVQTPDRWVNAMITNF
jgi:hypothetical protein